MVGSTAFYRISGRFEGACAWDLSKRLEKEPLGELVGAGAARTRLDAAARRGLTRFVGRTAELCLRLQRGCGAGGVIAWERERRERARGRGGR